MSGRNESATRSRWRAVGRLTKSVRYLLIDPKLPRWTLNADSRDQSLVDARDRSFQSAPCFCQFIRIWRLVLLFLPSATDWLSATQWNRTIAAVPTTRIFGSRYSSDRNFDFPLVALAMKVALSSTRPSEWL